LEHDMTDATPTTGGEPGKNPGATMGADTQTASTGATTFTQDQVNSYLAAEKRKWQEQQSIATDKARREAADAAATEQGKFKELAETREGRIKSLEPQLSQATERLKGLEELLIAEVEAGVKELPEELRAMRPDGDVLAQRAWLTKAQAAAAKLAPRSPGTSAGPNGTGGARSTQATSDQDLIAKKRVSGIY
jgi:hypothetical protein